jgi:hypothetical protein
MPTFQELLLVAGINPRDVRLLRHTSKSGVPGISPYAAWQDDRASFETYQATQASKYRRFFDAPYWASFVATPDGGTRFAGLYAVSDVKGPVEPFTCPLTRVKHDGAAVDRFVTTRVGVMDEHVGRLFDWGASPRAWRQFAHKNIKEQTNG